MDPICHTLVGASLSATGLGGKARYGRATLIIAANLPDIDGIAYFFGPAAYAVRRGVTHGVAAMAVLPVLLAFAMTYFARARGRGETSFRWMLALAAIGVATHPALDWLNTYGMRWLMPFLDRWYYGDSLFIADGWVWLLLLAGLVASRWLDAARLHWLQRPALWALAGLLVYIGANFAVTLQAERTALARLQRDPPQRLMASPVPLDPLRRALVLEYPNEYRFAKFTLDGEPRFTLETVVIEKGDPAVIARARLHREARWFLHWARFPYAVVANEAGHSVAYLADARYVRDIKDAPRGFGVFRVELDR